ncbi:SDR family NAD(P)-dependent oxidoreductase [Streptomyces sp. NPDC055722]
MSRLQNKTILVTGAANGIGAAAVTRFAAEDATVIATDVAETCGTLVVNCTEWPNVGGHQPRLRAHR